MAQWLKVLAALAEVPGSVLNIHMIAHNHVQLSSSTGTRQTHDEDEDTHAAKTLIYIKN